MPPETPPPPASAEQLRILQSIVEGLEGVLYSCLNDENRTALYLSEGIFALTGVRAYEFVRREKHYCELIHSGDRERVWREIQAAVGARQKYRLKYRIIRASGGVRWVSDIGGGLFAPDGSLEALQGLIADVTEQDRPEISVSEDDGRYRGLFLANPHPMWVYDLNTLRFLEVNDAAIDLYGYSREEFLAMTIADIRPNEDVPGVLEKARPVARGIDHAGVWRHLRKDGRLIDVEIASHALEYRGCPAELVMAIDTTERLRAEAVTRLQASALDAAANAIMITDRDGAIEWVNPAWTVLTGYTIDDAKGEAPRILESGAQGADHCERFVGDVGPGEIVQGDLVKRREDGSAYQEYETITRVLGCDGKKAHYIAVKQHTTEGRYAEERIQRLNRTYAVLSDINQLIVRASARECVLQGACDIAVTKGGFLLAWIALGAAGSPSLELVAKAGADAGTERPMEDFIRQLTLTGAVTREALSTGLPSLCNDIAGDPISLPWRQAALDRGYRAMASFPLSVAGQAAGTLNLCAAQKEFFDSEEVKLLGELASDIGFGLEVLDREVKRSQAELLLRESEARFRTVLETLASIGLMLDREGRVLLCSDHLLALTGWSRDEVTGRDWFSRFVPPEESENARLNAFLAAVQRGSIPTYFEDHVITRLGERRLIHWNNSVLRDEDGDIVAVMSLGEDVTDRRRAEMQVRELAAFPRLNPNPVLAFSAEGALTYSNPAAEELVRRMGAADVHSLLPQDAAALVRECIASGQARLRVLTRHGANTISWSFHPIPSEGVLHCYAGDITDRLALEEQLRQSQKMDAVGQLAGGVAHDFNNLLTVIQGNVSMALLPGASSETQIESLTEIATAAQRAAELTRQLLTFSRRQKIQPRVVDINEAVTLLGRMLARVIGERVQLQLHLHPGSLTTFADPGMLDQVLMNLAVNARDAMPDGGQLTIATGRVTLAGGERGYLPEPSAGPHVFVRVSDSGCGIPAENLAHIFEPFFTTKEPGRGTGLGLATVFGIVKQHNGALRVQSEIDCGTSFDVLLPAHMEDVRSTAGALDSSVPPGRGERILLVEDESAVRRLTVRLLGSQGYTVIEAADGKEALRLYAESSPPPDLVLTDLIMPGAMTGGDLAERLLAGSPNVRVVFMSGYASELVRGSLQLVEGVNFLSKPFQTDDLLRCLRARLDSPS